MPTKPITVGESIWSLNELIEHLEATGEIMPPFSADERLLAERLASAWFFYYELTELPARAPYGSPAGGAFFFGIHRVQRLRNEPPTSPATTV
jgi:hypothetical protein